MLEPIYRPPYLPGYPYSVVANVSVQCENCAGMVSLYDNGTVRGPIPWTYYCVKCAVEVRGRQNRTGV